MNNSLTERNVATSRSTRDTITADPIRALVEDTRSLNVVDADGFSRKWLLREFEAELHRYTIEAKFVDTANAAYQSSVDALADLKDSNDWVHPKLQAFLRACRNTASLEEMEWRSVDTIVDTPTPTKIRGCETVAPIQVSNVKAHYVPILEQNIGHAHICDGIVKAFSQKLELLRQRRGVTHLCFIEKAVGPVGAIGMMSSLVSATQLPACIYRETHWSEKSDLAAVKPTHGDKVAVVYDLVVSGAGICNAADIIRERVGADVVGAVVLCGFGSKRHSLTTNDGQQLDLESLTWWEEVEPIASEDSVARRESETHGIISKDLLENRQAGSDQPLSIDGRVGQAAPEKGDEVVEPTRKLSFAGRPASLMEKVKLEDFRRRVDALRDPGEVDKALKRRKEEYEAAWARYSSSVEQ